jgi:hypothetical protein
MLCIADRVASGEKETGNSGEKETGNSGDSDAAVANDEPRSDAAAEGAEGDVAGKPTTAACDDATVASGGAACD